MTGYVGPRVHPCLSPDRPEDALICPSLGIAGAAITTLGAQAVTTLAMVGALRHLAPQGIFR